MLPKYNSAFHFEYFLISVHIILHTLCIAFKYKHRHKDMFKPRVWPRLQRPAGPSLPSHLFVSSWTPLPAPTQHPSTRWLTAAPCDLWRSSHCTWTTFLSVEQCYLHQGWELLSWIQTVWSTQVRWKCFYYYWSVGTDLIAYPNSWNMIHVFYVFIF